MAAPKPARAMPTAYMAGALIWVAFFIMVDALLPLIPIDETRYMTVAWEMRVSHNWLLETVNGELYPHKPPLLFWLINVLWLVTGPQAWTARVVAGAAALALYSLTRRLALTLYPERRLIGTLAPLFLLGCPAFLRYGGMIMFDTMLACFTVLALEQSWRAVQAESKRALWKAWALFGLFTGLGVLTKGPVIGLYVFFPALLAPFFMERPRIGRLRWYGGILLGLLIATMIGLAWAVPAAMQGGGDFAEALFVKQSAGRMVDSFAHKRPFWFFIPCLLVFALPFMCWAPFWRAAVRGRTAMRDDRGLFLLCALVLPFIAFSLISGKQIHYMVPMLPAAAILLAALAERATAAPRPLFRPADAFGPLALLLLILTAAFYFLHTHKALHSHSRLIAMTAQDFMMPLFLSAILLGGIAAYCGRRRLETQLLSVSFSIVIFTAAILWQAHDTMLPFYDLRAVSAGIQPYKAGPLAIAEKYAGEIGYLAQLPHPIDVLQRADIPAWFSAHPDGTVIMRHSYKASVDDLGRTVGNYSYKAKKDWTLLQAR